jgi:N-acetylglucosamine kinase-like BadF-type ATPase
MTAHRESAAEFLLAVDAGGSKTVAWLADMPPSGPPHVLGRGGAGGGNPLSVGFDAATRAVADAVAAAQRDATRPPPPIIARAVLSVAGAADPEVADQLVQWARKSQLAAKIAVVSDVLPVLAAGSEEGWGVALVAGTGSVAFGRTADGRTCRSGGWGYLLGDEGSGYAIGRAAVRHALQHDESADVLSRKVLANVSATSAVELTKAVYRARDPRAAIASLAATVAAAADNGDPAARQILDTAAGDLATLVAESASKLGFTGQNVPLAVAGGVLVGSKYVRDALESQLRTVGLRCDVRLVPEPVAGCLRLASAAWPGPEVPWQ